ncbi:MAG: hypothetical protein LCH46_04600 [Proteobacteria bacterium]|nr:hypothetical protein [Pseudomonadota bacterium]
MFKNPLILAALAAAFAPPAFASAFWAGEVINVSGDDVLNLRKWPAAYSQVIHEYDNGDNISLTGRCKNTATNVSFYIDGSQSASWKYNRMKKANVWCQAMSPDAGLGWVRGKYVWPQ